MYLYPYKNGSQGAKDLANALGIKQIKREGSKFKGDANKLIINWGSSTMNEEVGKCELLNNPEAVALASNKLSFFKAMEKYNLNNYDEISFPYYTEKKDNAAYLIDDGHSIVARTILNGHSGEGIVLCNSKEELEEVDAPLYVQYIPKKQEYRVHVLMGDIVDIQRKARRRDLPDDQVDWKIRNHKNGFVYVRDEKLSDLPNSVKSNALLAIACSGLDFGAVDIIYNDKNKRSYVLEINTAPGLSGATLAGYTERFNQLKDFFEHKRKVRIAGNWKDNFAEEFAKHILKYPAGVNYAAKNLYIE